MKSVSNLVLTESRVLLCKGIFSLVLRLHEEPLRKLSASTCDKKGQAIILLYFQAHISNSSPNDKILDLCNLEALADNKPCVAQKIGFSRE